MRIYKFQKPKYGALTVFRSNILGADTNTLTDKSLYLDEPEKVNLGISFSTVADNAMLALHTGEVLSSESTALETVLLITLADSDDPTTPVDVTSSTYNFALSKSFGVTQPLNIKTLFFIIISLAEGNQLSRLKNSSLQINFHFDWILQTFFNAHSS